MSRPAKLAGMNDEFPPGTGLAPAETLRSLSGFEFLSRLARGELPPPPISHTMNMRIESVERGKVVFTSTPGAFAYNPIRSIHGGYAATLLDSCMGCAVQSMVEAGFGYTTLELKVSYVRGLTHDSGELRATGRALHVGRRSGFAEGEIVDARGRLIAHGTTTCLVFPQ